MNDPVDPYFPPQVYDWFWWIILPVFLLLLAAWIILSRVIAKRAARPVEAPPAPVIKRYVPPPDAGPKAFARIDRVRRQFEAGDIDTRDAHIELSEIVRDFGYQRTGIDARSMTLEELRESRLVPIADAVSGWYPIAFAPDADEDIGPALDSARGVVQAWS
ncbi:hypothetical protein GCM10027515_25030 [Schumannella luteola]|uniref:Uncharacterized protein n=1 Tax=Schumannella luteola TaxID=472059 RepID=A0A852YPP4_9MICO|nr:hypothetical protein [Schumannella luteola]NYG99699.1 hypothetical protein [Schumannella luteola]TPX06481.1 hypothetical protein FJ656_00585 [Schumannella luteola]